MRVERTSGFFHCFLIWFGFCLVRIDEIPAASLDTFHFCCNLLHSIKISKKNSFSMPAQLWSIFFKYYFYKE